MVDKVMISITADGENHALVEIDFGPDGFDPDSEIHDLGSYIMDVTMGVTGYDTMTTHDVNNVTRIHPELGDSI